MVCPMEIFLIRHGQPDWAPARIATNDPELTELGHRQSLLLADRIAGWERLDEVLVSTMRRAQQTAAPLQTFGLQPAAYDWLQEINNPPDWEGSPVDRIEEILAKGRLRPIDEMWDGLPGGESFRDFHKRVVAGLEDALAARGLIRLIDGHPHLWHVANDSLRLAIVAHGGANAVILGTLLGLEPTPWEWERFAMGHASIAHLRTEKIAEGRAFSLRAFADASHLPPELRTE